MDNPAEILDLLRMVECNFDVTRINYKGINFWPLVRNEIRLNLGLNTEGKSWDLKANTSSTKELIKLPYQYLKCMYYKQKYIRSLVPLKSKFQVCTYPVSLFIDAINGKKYCRYIDPYFEVLKELHKDTNYICFLNEDDQPVDTLNPVSYLSLKDFNNYFDLKVFLLRSHKAEWKIVESLNLVLDEINALIYSRYKVKPVFNEVLKSFIYIYEAKGYFDQLFKCSKVKYFFIEDHYIYLQMAICASAKKNDVQVIEFQHGIIDFKYYPYTDKTGGDLLPDYVWCWSDSDRDLLAVKNPEFKYLVPFTGGNMWLRKFKLGEFYKISEKEKLYINNLRSEYRKVVLISLQSTFLLSDIMLETIARAPKDFFFLVRFHPLNTTEEEKEVINQRLSGFVNAETDFSSKINLYYLFEKCDFQITHSSATAIEALSFNLPTIVCSEIGNELYKEQIKNGVVLFSTDTEQILNILKSETNLLSDKASYYLIKTELSNTIEVLKTVLT